MKYLKLVFKLFFVLLIPLLFQIVVALGFLIYHVVDFVIKSSGEITDSYEIGVEIGAKIMSAMSMIVLISGCSTILFFYLIHKSKKRKSMSVSYRFNKINLKLVLYTLAITMFGIIFTSSIEVLMNLKSLDLETSEMLNKLVTEGSLIITLLSVGIIGPICEEIIFRGSILKNLSEKMNIKWAIIIQAVLFSLYHMNLIQAIPALIIGLIAGILVYYTNSIWSGIILHISNNVIAILISKFALDDFMISSPILILTLAISLGGIVYLFKKMNSIKEEWLPLEERIVDELVAVKVVI